MCVVCSGFACVYVCYCGVHITFVQLHVHCVCMPAEVEESCLSSSTLFTEEGSLMSSQSSRMLLTCLVSILQGPSACLLAPGPGVQVGHPTAWPLCRFWGLTFTPYPCLVCRNQSTIRADNFLTENM